MTDDELKALVASLAVAQKETDKHINALRLSQQETDKQISQLRLSQQETGMQISQLRLSQQETDQQIKETDLQLKETDRQLRRQLKELGKQIGGLGDKFGGFTEGMAFPSMTKILTEHFGMEVITPRVKAKKNGENLELDVLAYANSNRNEAFIVEIKSHLRAEGIEQLKQSLQQFRRFFPEHGDKKLYGMLAVVDAPNDLRQQALREGLYMAGIHDEQFIVETPQPFTPKSW